MIDAYVVKSGKTQSEVAKWAEVDTSSLSRWRRGEQGCPAHRVEKLAMALGLDTRNTEILLRLALDVENENQKEREALRSPGLRNELRDLKESIRSLEEQVRQLQEYVRFPLPQQAPQEGNRPG